MSGKVCSKEIQGAADAIKNDRKAGYEAYIGKHPEYMDEQCNRKSEQAQHVTRQLNPFEIVSFVKNQVQCNERYEISMRIIRVRERILIVQPLEGGVIACDEARSQE